MVIQKMKRMTIYCFQNVRGMALGHAREMPRTGANIAAFEG